MGLYESLAAVRAAEGETLVDWEAAATAACASTPRGELDLDSTTEIAYRDATAEARAAIGETVGRSVSLPPSVEVLDRHHWIEQAARSFERMLTPSLPSSASQSVAQTVNTSSAAFTLAVLGRRVIGQYEPALFGDPDDTALYVVHPNVTMVAGELAVDPDTFTRWILHHEVAHAAEFDLAPWLRPYLETRLSAILERLGHGSFDRSAFEEITRAMTAVEGFAELLMDASMTDDVSHLRDRLEARRAGIGPVQQLIDWLLGISSKRRQYARGREFFEAIADTRGIEATLAVWDDPANLPTAAELEAPATWLERVDPPV